MPARTAVYTGSFDPITLGHVSVIERSSQLFDQLVIGIGHNAEKKSLFSVAERISLIERVTRHLPNIKVLAFEGLAVEFVRKVGSRVMIRGIRPLTDIAGEFTMMMANRQLDPEVETVFLMADEELAHVSSSLIKQIALLADDAKLSKFLPAEIIPDLREKLLKEGS